MAAPFNPEQARQRTVYSRAAAPRIVGNRDPDREHVEDHLDLGRTLLQINAQLADEVEGMKGHCDEIRSEHSTTMGAVRHEGRKEDRETMASGL